MSIHTTYKFRHFRGDELIWASGLGELDGSIRRGSPGVLDVIEAQGWQDNELVNQGEQSMLDVFFRNGAVPESFFFRLYDATITDPSTLSSISGDEVTGDGYSGIAVARGSSDWPLLDLDGGDYQVTSATKTFNATGGWTAASQLVLATSGSDTSGLLIAYAPLSQTRTLAATDSLEVSMAVKLT